MSKQIEKIGIISPNTMERRTTAIATGRYVPRPDEPKYWAESKEQAETMLFNQMRFNLPPGKLEIDETVNYEEWFKHL